MSQGSYQTARCLSDLADEYRQLLEGSLSDHAAQSQHGILRHENFAWTRVLSMSHFAVSGCLNNSLDEDLLEAQEEFAALYAEAR